MQRRFLLDVKGRREGEHLRRRRSPPAAAKFMKVGGVPLSRGTTRPAISRCTHHPVLVLGDRQNRYATTILPNPPRSRALASYADVVVLATGLPSSCQRTVS